LIKGSFQGLSVAIGTMRIVEELMEIWPNEVCNKYYLELLYYCAGFTLADCTTGNLLQKHVASG